MAQPPTAPENDFAPYAPPANVLGVIQRFRDYDLPGQAFTPDFMERIGVPSGSTHRTIAALKYLGLLDKDTGEPTDAWRRLRVLTDDDFAPGLEAVVRNAYGDVFKIADPARDTQARIADAFRTYSPAKQREKMVTLFLSLASAAGIATVDTPRRRTSAAGNASSRAPGATSTTTRTPASTAKATAPESRRPHGADITVITAHPLIAGLLRTLPADDAAWTSAERQRWLKAVESVVDLLFPVKVTASDSATVMESATVRVVPELSIRGARPRDQ